ncbi:alcohol acyltransferase 9 [Beta vulgaris subsp. vulgaris]|uniref:alcohol acyltransferase 9 n=1 Tax=Beta vulgaris subsp. vulgaris TaxID=3555 RepID=UPI0025499F07|nr:alcohol acyltransferase 9 [Beta vulgaris subsp. vulgaris]
MASNFVQVKEAISITPSQPTPNCTLSLSTIDSQLFLRFTIEYLLVYNPSHGLDRRQFVARIKSALGRALVQYYPLAGRVQERRGGPLQVVCRAQGAVFVEAVSGYKRPDFERAPRYVEEWRQLLWLQVDDVLKGAPPLVVQLTWLADGAVAVGFGFNHCVCDGIGSAEFINSFAELTRGVSARGPKPVWDRHLLDPFTSSNNRSKMSVRDSLVVHPVFTRVQDSCGFLARFSSEKLVPTSNIFVRGHINQLKRQASRLTESTKYTSFEVVSAHIWKCWAKSLHMPGNQVLRLFFSVNFRNRIKPRLPVGFYGNGFTLGCAVTTVNDLTEKGIGYGAELIKRAKERVDGKYVKQVIELVSENRTSPDSVGVLVLSQWSRLGLERVDFGLGKPAHVGPICSDKYCLLLPVNNNQREAVRVMLAVPTSAVDMYQHLLRKPFSSN